MELNVPLGPLVGLALRQVRERTKDLVFVCADVGDVEEEALLEGLVLGAVAIEGVGRLDEITWLGWS